MSRARGARQGKVAPEIEKQVAKLSEKIHVAVVEYDVTKKPTTEFIRNTQDTTEFIRKTKPTTEFIKNEEPTTKYIKTEEPTTKYIKKEEPTTKYIEKTEETTRFVEKVLPTTRYDVKVEPTTKYDVKHEPLELEKIVKKALDDLIEKNRVVLKRAKYEDEIIKVFELEFTCPHCNEKFSLGGRKK